MKPTHYGALAALLLAGGPAAADAIVQESAWTEHYPVSSPTAQLVIDNIWGGVRVRTGNVDRISITISERRSAPSPELFELSKSVLFLDTRADASGVAIYVGDREKHWQRANRCNDCRVDYQFDVVVPNGATVDVRTVLDGRVVVTGDLGTVSAGNVNGPIRVDGLSNCGHVANVNGPIELDFADRPASDCSIETINGDITLTVPADAGIDMALDLFNGRIVSDLDVEPVALPATVEHITDNGRQAYRIEKPAGLRVGAGGPSYRISSMNGDVRIRKL